jgi:hypothetical protein
MSTARPRAYTRNTQRNQNGILKRLIVSKAPRTRPLVKLLPIKGLDSPAYREPDMVLWSVYLLYLFQE